MAKAHIAIGTAISVVAILAALVASLPYVSRTEAALTFTVNSTGDAPDADTLDDICDTGTGACTLRSAIEQANATAGADTIAFNLSPTPAIIQPASCLPVISEAAAVDATTQPGYAGTPLVELDGSLAACGHGLGFASAGGSVRGMAISSFTSAVLLDSGSSGITVAGNFIGLHASGSAWLSNSRGIDVRSPSNTIGGTAAANRNVIANNSQAGIYLSGADADNNTIKGNYIGTNATGTASSSTGTGEGIFIGVGATGNAVGGSSASERNVISGNVTHGIELEGGSNIVQGNLIGTDPSGTAVVANGSRGIFLDGGDDNVIGGASAGEGNLISGNGDDGIRGTGANGTIIQGNLIGTSVTGLSALSNGNRGIFLATSDSIQIGGTTAQSRNVISGNGSGILVGSTNDEWSGITLEGNYIGVGSDGVTSIPNTAGGATFIGRADSGNINLTIGGTVAGSGNIIKGGLTVGTRTQGAVLHGNDITNSSGVALTLFNALGVQVGGTGAGEANVIAGSTSDGVANDRTNLSLGLNNTIRGNSIHSNTGIGINNANGANLELAVPVITGTDPVSGTACANCTIDVYSDASNEGAIYHGSTVANGAGAWSLATDLTGPNVTATATDAAGNTSEFSAAVPCLDTDNDGLCNAGDPDDDNDGNPDITDGCPTTITQWFTPAGDVDCDGFTTADEMLITTDPNDNCGFVAGGTPYSGTWPVDLVESNSVNISDVLALKDLFGTSVPPTSARYDIAPSGGINISDVLIIKPYFGLSCTP